MPRLRPAYGGTFGPHDCVPYTCTVVLLKAASRQYRGETVRLAFFSRSTVPQEASRLYISCRIIERHADVGVQERIEQIEG